ncbi:MAG: cobalamin biosynthesis protein CbiG [Pseudomonadota bacterium]
MTQALFDRWIVVDWSAAATPVTGKNSIWIADLTRDGLKLHNPPTREAAMALVSETLIQGAAAGDRMLASFDFPFGYPAGVASSVFGVNTTPRWRGVWAHLAREITDGPKNSNNRFAVADALNAAFGNPGPFWGRPRSHALLALPERKPSGYGAILPTERRLVEQGLKRAQPVWKLYTTGSVGGQALTGIAALERLRATAPLPITVWPFETGLAPPRIGPGETVLAEIYPSLVDPAVRASSDPIKDRAQVRLLAEAMATLDNAARLAPLFAGPPDPLPETALTRVIEEEGWILGAGYEATLLAALQPSA